MFEVVDENGERVLPESVKADKPKRGRKKKNVNVDSEGKPKRGRPPMNPEDRKPKRKPKRSVGKPRVNMTPTPVTHDFIDPFVNAAGRPIEYAPWMCKKIIQVAMEGGFQSAMMIACGISSGSTLRAWRAKYPEFGEAYAMAEMCQQAYLERIAVDLANGTIERGNATALICLLNSKFKNEYTRAVGGNNNTEITINTVNLTGAQMDTQIAQKLEKLKSLGIAWDGLVPNAESNIVDAEYDDGGYVE